MGLAEFTARECDYFRAASNFTVPERAVFDLRVRGCSIVEIAMELHVSASTVDRRVRAVKRKIEKVL